MGAPKRKDGKLAKSRADAKRQQLTRMAWGLTMENRLREHVMAKRAERAERRDATVTSPGLD
jgi:hypothetical protein